MELHWLLGVAQWEWHLLCVSNLPWDTSLFPPCQCGGHSVPVQDLGPVPVPLALIVSPFWHPSPGLCHWVGSGQFREGF